MVAVPSSSKAGIRPQQKQRVRRGLGSRMAATADAYSPEFNLTYLANAVEAGDVTPDLYGAFAAVEGALHALAVALTLCQPRGAAKSVAIRWWRTDGAKAVLRRPVLVRIEAHGKSLLPRRLVIGRRPKLRKDGAFSTNADLVPRLLTRYDTLYGEWRGLYELLVKLSAYRRSERTRCAKAEEAAAESRVIATVSANAGRGRAEAAGYDMTWAAGLLSEAGIE